MTTRQYRNTGNYTDKRTYRDKQKSVAKKKQKKLSFIDKVVNGIKSFFNK